MQIQNMAGRIFTQAMSMEELLIALPKICGMRENICP